MNFPDNSEAMSASYLLLRASLLRYINRRVGDPAIAEDLLHDVFIKALKADEKNSVPGNLSSWLYTIARNTVIDYYRCKRPTEVLPEHLAVQTEDDQRESQYLASCLLTLAAELPPIYRDTLLATDLGNQTMSSLAAKENITVSAVKSRASRGRKLLKQKLLDCCQIETSDLGAVIDYYHKDCNSACGEDKAVY